MKKIHPNKQAEIFFKKCVNGTKKENIKAFIFEAADIANQIAEFLFIYNINVNGIHNSDWDHKRYEDLYLFVANAAKQKEQNNPYFYNFNLDKWNKWNE